MKIDITKDFIIKLLDQVLYILQDKPIAARKFKTELIKNIRKDLKQPFQFKKSIYFDDENIRDDVLKVMLPFIILIWQKTPFLSY